MKDVLMRALKTFWQAALSYLILNSEMLFNDFLNFNFDKLKQFVIALALGTLAAGLSAMYNGVLKPLAENFKKEEE